MAAGRFTYGTGTYVEAPAFTPAGGGILDKADVREGTVELLGYRFESELPETQLGTVTNFSAQSATDAMTEGDGRTFEVSGDPFTIYGAFALDGPLTDTAAAEARARQRLEMGEGLAVEKALWNAGGMLPSQATIVRSGAMKTKLAIGLLAEWYAANTNGTPYFHCGRRLTNEIAAQQLVEEEIADAQVKGGGALVNGAGYFGKTPIGGTTPTADQVWVYATGAPVLYRSAVGVSSAMGIAAFAAHNRNTAFAIRTYVPALDGPVGALLVDLNL